MNGREATPRVTGVGRGSGLNDSLDLDHLPEPDDLAAEIIENLEAGLSSFRTIANALR